MTFTGVYLHHDPLPRPAPRGADDNSALDAAFERGLEMRSFSRPAPRDGMVEIRVAASGVCRPDLMQYLGTYPPPPDCDPVLGLEVAGVIERVGAGVHQFEVGQRVMALTHGGGWRSHTLVDARHVCPLPDTLSFEQGAALPETLMTVWHNLFELGRALDGQRVFVHGGNSGIGLGAIFLARAFGLEAFTAVRQPAFLHPLQDMGAQALLYDDDQPLGQRVKDLTGGAGVDVVLDLLGGRFIEQDFKMLSPYGRLVSIAFLDSERTDARLTPLMLKRLVWTGSTLRSQSDADKARLMRAVQRWALPRVLDHPLPLSPQTVLPFPQAHDGLRLIYRGGHFGKIVLSYDLCS